MSHFTDNKAHNRLLDGETVDIGTDIDWTISTFNEARKTSIDGDKWIDHVRSEYYTTAAEQASAKCNVVLPHQKNGEEYCVDKSPKQSQIVYKAVETIIKFLNNDPTYRPMRATIMGGGGTGKSFIINTIITMIRKLTACNDTVQVAAPSGAAAFNVQGSTIHRLLNVNVNSPEKPLPEKSKDRLKKQLQRLLCLIIDERSMISSKVLAAAERNTRQCIYDGHNSGEVWGGLPVVLLFGDDYQLMPIGEGAIQSFSKRKQGSLQHVTDKMTSAQLLAYRGGVLFTEVMTQDVYFLTKNYRVSCKKFRNLLGRVRKGRPSNEDAQQIMNLHLHFYENSDPDFVATIENDEKTMWLFTNNADKDEKNVKKLVETSKNNKVPIARMDCSYESNKLQDGSENRAVKSHFDKSTYMLIILIFASVQEWQ